MARAIYRVVSCGISDRGNVVLIRDLDGPVSVTNDAEAVVEEMLQWQKVNLPESTFKGREFIIHYIDTDGRRDRLLHDGTKFTDFAPVDP